ncbi:transcriptional regulator [Klebsiella michiganensis]|uniref:Transcriptional regulator n=1 Tax=Klebsiella michiganensis TaxID=1134687 RepID=A0A7H4PMR0_9ENTR|nr:transcriptional regulator [Klebsiella michiganensis]
MSTTLTFNFQHRPLVPFAHDYAHGDSEPWHQHDCAQLLHILSGVVRVETAQGYWIVPPGRGVWLPAGTPHTLRVTGVAGRANPVYRSPCPGRSPLILPDSPGDSAAA